VPAHHNVRTHKCIAHCLPAAAGECACPAHAADGEGRQDDDAAFYQITLDTWSWCSRLLMTSQQPVMKTASLGCCRRGLDNERAVADDEKKTE